MVLLFAESSPGRLRTNSFDIEARAFRNIYREGVVANISAAPATSAWSSLSSHAAEQWRRAAQLADSDVAAASHEVERVANDIRAKQQREVGRWTSRAVVKHIFFALFWACTLLALGSRCS